MTTTELNSMDTSIEQWPPTHLMSMLEHPTMSEYYGNLTPFIILSMFIAMLVFLLNIAIYYTTVSQLRQRLTKPLVNISIAVCSPYPLISLAALMTILIPKAWLICHTVMHLSFTFGAVFFHRLCIKYVDSEMNFIKETDCNAVAINTPPCCCCCMCLPGVIPTKSKFMTLKYFIWQMPFVQGSVMLVLNVIYYREPEFYVAVMRYFMPFIICSILVGIWGLNIIVGMVNSVYSDYSMRKKMFCLQLILLLCKLQYLVMDNQLDSLSLGGTYPINHTIIKQTFINLLILVEMILVSLLAQHSYKTPVQIVAK